jgi:hypothetical protein
MKPTHFDMALQRAADRARAREEAKVALDLAKAREHVAKALLRPKHYLAKFKRKQQEHMKNLRDPNWNHVRYYPCFFPGSTTTREYIRSYQALNRKTSNAAELTFDHATMGPAPYEVQE